MYCLSFTFESRHRAMDITPPLDDARRVRSHRHRRSREYDVSRIARERPRVALERAVVVPREVDDAAKWISFASSRRRARDEREGET